MPKAAQSLNTIPLKSRASKGLKEWIFSEETQLLLIAIPFVVFVFLFSYLPLFGWSFAFLDYKPGVPFVEQQFVGFKHFINLFGGGSEFLLSLRNTLVFSFIGLALTPLPIIFALMLGEIRNRAVSKAVQTFTTLPNFISWILVFAVCFMFFSSDGMINNIITRLGISDQPVEFLGNENMVWFFQSIVGIWKSLGWSGIIYIAAMSSIDQELYNAAEVDGAGRFRKMWYITIPGLMPTFIVLLLLNVSGMLNSGFEQYYVFHNALVHSRIEVLDTYVYRTGIGRYEFSFSTAVGLFKSVVSIALLFTVNWISKRVRGQSIV